MIFDGVDHVITTLGSTVPLTVSLILHFHHRLTDASCEMLLTPALVLLSIILNFCALLHVTSNWNGLSDKRWSTLDRAVYALEEAAVTAYGNYLDIVAPPPLTTSPVSFPPLHHAEWVYRSSVVRILDLVDGHSRNKSVSDVASRASVSPSPPKPKDPVAPARIPPPGLAPLVHPATFEKIPAYDPSTASMAASSAIRFLGLTGLAFLGYTLIFAWLKVSSATLTSDISY